MKRRRHLNLLHCHLIFLAFSVIQLQFYHQHDFSSFKRISSLLANQYGIPAMDVLVASEANQCTNVSADCLTHNFISYRISYCNTILAGSVLDDDELYIYSQKERGWAMMAKIGMDGGTVEGALVVVVVPEQKSVLAHRKEDPE
ncbi:hypothetical protein POTOM_011581 [Populus tomentosa]|uniref:Uncharacterized protein n=1 Tax=Populus tomentosa TaxID=118781 RepID=A0A8X8A5T2_POPTO|nr:hypothetical protein POTOM_011581 [Populus tomentosa]